MPRSSTTRSGTRFAQLWDERVAHVREHPGDKAELNGFYWFVMSQKFPVEWWLPRLKEAAELGADLSTERYMIGKQIASAADVDPRGAFDALKLVLKGRDEVGIVSYDLHAARRSDGHRSCSRLW